MYFYILEIKIKKNHVAAQSENNVFFNQENIKPNSPNNPNNSNKHNSNNPNNQNSNNYDF